MPDDKQAGRSIDPDQQKDRRDSDGDHDAVRRAALRKIATGLGMVGGAAALPERWTKPVVETIVRPAWAQETTMTTTETTVM